MKTLASQGHGSAREVVRAAGDVGFAPVVIGAEDAVDRGSGGPRPAPTRRASKVSAPAFMAHLRATRASAKGSAPIIFSRTGELHRHGERIGAGPASPHRTNQ